MAISESNKRRGVTSLFLLLIFFLGSSAKDVITKSQLKDITPLDMSLLISLVVVISTSVIIVVKILLGSLKRETCPTRSIFSKLLLLSVLTSLALYFSILAIDFIGPISNTVTNVVVYPISVLFLSIIYSHENVQKSTLTSIIISFIGLIIFYLPMQIYNNPPILGLIVSISSAVCFACSLIIVKELLSVGLPAEEIVVYRFSLLGFLSLFILPRVFTKMPIETFKAVSVLAVLGYTVLFLILFYGLKEIPANMISVFAAGAPFYTAFFNWLILGEKSYSILQIIGLFIVFIGLIYVVVNELLNKGVIKAASTKILRYR